MYLHASAASNDNPQSSSRSHSNVTPIDRPLPTPNPSGTQTHPAPQQPTAPRTLDGRFTPPFNPHPTPISILDTNPLRRRW
jgi:hypothetical protein